MKKTEQERKQKQTAVTPAAKPKVVGATVAVSAEQSLDELIGNLERRLGTKNFVVAARVVEQVSNALTQTTPQSADASLIQCIRTIEEFEPQSLTEAMLAAQTVATHEAALVFMRRARVDGQTTEGIDANVLRATRLMRLNLEQIEAMQKLKGKAGQQKVTVEHVHVHKGGQAIVGAVTAPKRAGGGGK